MASRDCQFICGSRAIARNIWVHFGKEEALTKGTLALAYKLPEKNFGWGFKPAPLATSLCVSYISYS